MEKKTKFDAMKMIRQIRDQHAEILKGNSPQQIKEFYKNCAEEMDARIRKANAKAKSGQAMREPLGG